MAIFQIANEAQTNIASVLSNKSLKVAQAHTYKYLASAEATGVITTSPGILHAVVFQDSATATTYLALFNNADSASADVVGSSASAVAVFGTILKGVYPLNVAFNSLLYRVTGSALGATTIVYSVAN